MTKKGTSTHASRRTRKPISAMQRCSRPRRSCETSLGVLLLLLPTRATYLISYLHRRTMPPLLLRAVGILAASLAFPLFAGTTQRSSFRLSRMQMAFVHSRRSGYQGHIHFSPAFDYLTPHTMKNYKIMVEQSLFCLLLESFLVLFNFGRTEKMWTVCGEKTHILPTAYQYFVHN